MKKPPPKEYRDHIDKYVEAIFREDEPPLLEETRLNWRDSLEMLGKEEYQLNSKDICEAVAERTQNYLDKKNPNTPIQTQTTSQAPRTSPFKPRPNMLRIITGISPK